MSIKRKESKSLLFLTNFPFLDSSRVSWISPPVTEEYIYPRAISFCVPIIRITGYVWPGLEEFGRECSGILQEFAEQWGSGNRLLATLLPLLIIVGMADGPCVIFHKKQEHGYKERGPPILLSSFKVWVITLRFRCINEKQLIYCVSPMFSVLLRQWR